MMDLLSQYGLFLLQTVTVLAAVLVVIGLSSRMGHSADERTGHLKISDLSERLEKQKGQLEAALHTDRKKTQGSPLRERLGRLVGRLRGEKQAESKAEDRPVAVVIEFKGDMKASQVAQLRQEVTAILSMETPPDRVLLKLTSPGGLVHAYGLASAQLSRLNEAGIALTVAVDTVAASGGYMMAVCAERIVAAPFAVLGSIGVVAQVPNVHRFLKNRDVDVELHTAGQNKRTLTVLGENTQEGRQKFKEDLEQTHVLFKSWIHARRPALDLDVVADGSIFYGVDALERGLCDALGTSDDVLLEWHQSHRLVQLHWVEKKSLMARLGRDAADATLERVEQFFVRGPEDFTR